MATYGLRLTHPGAPNSPHVVLQQRDNDLVPLVGLYRPDVPTPVGDGEVMSLDAAKALDADSRIPLEFVALDDSATASSVAQADAEAARKSVKALRKTADGAEVQQASDEITAVGGSN